jgi:UDP-2,4-diacetamido-2,4,6-trideoxy-beta-L-altropyranose hydrolase
MPESGILVRTDASGAIGTGHSMRCLALAEVCHEIGLSVTIASAELPPSQKERWSKEYAACERIAAIPGSLEDADTTADLSVERSCNWIVIDGYQFCAAYQKRLKDRGRKLLCIDDFAHTSNYYADCVLNPNAYASRALYPQIETNTRLLLGARYLMLRREFRDDASQRDQVAPRRASKLLVTLGGSDPANATATVLEALSFLGDVGFDVRLVVGGSNPNLASLNRTAAALPFRVETIRDASAMANLMGWADLAITAAGTTAWELVFKGVPLLTIVTAENQQLVAEFLEQHHMAVNLGSAAALEPKDLSHQIRSLSVDLDRRSRMSRLGRNLIDGQGAYRVIQELGLASLRLQRSTQADSKILWEWANDPEVRRLSFSSDAIPWEIHQQWYTRKLKDPNSAGWIGFDIEDRPIGLVRFDRSSDGRLDVGVSVAAGFRGRGFGTELIRQGLRRISFLFPRQPAHAWIKAENLTSIRAFEQAGFELVGKEIVKGSKALHYISQPGLARSVPSRRSPGDLPVYSKTFE